MRIFTGAENGDSTDLFIQVIEISEYRAQLFEYLKNRMMAVAPNLTVLVGELVGARLIAHAGSLLNLAKHPSSTVQILGAEKALFRAMKTKHDTPKYGLIYHASLVGQTSAKLKGKVSRMLAAKAALSIRVDALGEDTQASLGIEQRADLEKKFANLEQNAVSRVFLRRTTTWAVESLQTKRISGTGKMQAKFDKYQQNSYVSIVGRGSLVWLSSFFQGQRIIQSRSSVDITSETPFRFWRTRRWCQ